MIISGSSPNMKNLGIVALFTLIALSGALVDNTIKSDFYDGESMQSVNLANRLLTTKAPSVRGLYLKSSNRLQKILDQLNKQCDLKTVLTEHGFVADDSANRKTFGAIVAASLISGLVHGAKHQAKASKCVTVENCLYLYPCRCLPHQDILSEYDPGIGRIDCEHCGTKLCIHCLQSCHQLETKEKCSNVQGNHQDETALCLVFPYLGFSSTLWQFGENL